MEKSSCFLSVEKVSEEGVLVWHNRREDRSNVTPLPCVCEGRWWWYGINWG